MLLPMPNWVQPDCGNLACRSCLPNAMGMSLRLVPASDIPCPCDPKLASKATQKTESAERSIVDAVFVRFARTDFCLLVKAL